MTAPAGSVVERGVLEADEGVARILALEDGGDGEALRQDRRHVLHRMHGEVDVAGEQRLLQLLGEQPLAAGLDQRPVGDPVAGRLDDDQLALLRRKAVRGAEARGHLARLGQRQGRAARADADLRCLQAVLSGC